MRKRSLQVDRAMRGEGEILYVIGSLNRGGAERHVGRIASELKRRGFRTSVFCLSEEGACAEELRKMGVEVIAPWVARKGNGHFLKRLAGIAPALVQLFVCLMRRRPGIVHAFLPEATILAGALSWVCRVPVRISSRRSLNFYRERRKILGPLESWVLRRCMHSVLGNSCAVVKQLLEEGVAERKVGLIYNGIELGELRASPGSAAEGVVFTNVANLIPYKGHLDLLEACARFHDSYTGPWTLFCLGEDSGGIGAGLRARAEELAIGEHIRWEGGVDDVDGYLSASDVGMLVSHEEGFSNAVLEGMAAGLPMIVTDVGGNAEAVIDEVCGLVVPPKDADEIANAMLRLAASSELRERMGASARRRVEEHFSLDACVDRYEIVYAALRRGEDASAAVPVRAAAGAAGTEVIALRKQ